MKWKLVALFLITSVYSYSTDTLHIYINNGLHKLVDGNTTGCKSFNSTSTFEYGANLFKATTDSFVLSVTNNDSIAQNIELGSVMNVTVDAGITLSSSISLSAGIYKLSSVTDYQSYLGLFGWIAIEEPNTKAFYWNIKEIQTSFNEDLAQGKTVDFSQYNPNYFMVNGKSNPEIGTDSLAKIVGKVGDTLYLNILNSGNSIHSLHFHGYHFTVVESSRSQSVVGWEKDTYPVYPNELAVFRLVPDKPGEYPIHDHNLVATTSNNIYPSGMFTTMIITP